MRTTRRLLERRSSGVLALALSLSLMGGATASCSSDDANDADMKPGGGDASPDAANDSQTVEDVVDAAAPDALLVDATPLAIQCETPPCAVALATTLRGESYSREEGYCALLSDGTVACWGANTAGQLGNGKTSGPDSPVGTRVPGLSGITAIDHTCAVDSDGAVWCWGRGPFIENEASPTTVTGSPVRIDLPGPAEKVAVSEATGCALLRDKNVACWGSNNGLLIGPGITARYTPPQRVELPAGVKNIAVGLAAFALYDDGKVLSWGYSPGVGRASPFEADGWPSPIALEHLTMIDTIEGESCAVANGIGWCWGPADPKGSLRSPDPYARALPAAVDTPQPITRIATSKSWGVSENNTEYYEKHRWCATSVTGQLYCWGLNNSGQAGDGTKEFATSTVRVAGLPAPAAEVKIMPYSTCTILTNGKVYCWGSNSNGQVGAGLPKGSVLTPTEVKLP